MLKHVTVNFQKKLMKNYRQFQLFSFSNYVKKFSDLLWETQKCIPSSIEKEMIWKT